MPKGLWFETAVVVGTSPAAPPNIARKSDGRLAGASYILNIYANLNFFAFPTRVRTGILIPGRAHLF